nr:MAG TPA: hypothetical protein [Caudoviricetes sp.]
MSSDSILFFHDFVNIDKFIHICYRAGFLSGTSISRLIGQHISSSCLPVSILTQVFISSMNSHR